MLLFRAKEVGGGSFSALNPFATIWCAVENIFLAAAAEGLGCSMRIPMDEEHEAVKKALKVSATYRLPVFIGIGHADAALRARRDCRVRASSAGARTSCSRRSRAAAGLIRGLRG